MSELIGLEALRAKVLARREPLGAITMAPRDALGFVLAAPVVAIESIPSFANSAMDGYALRSADTSDAGVSLAVIGATMAGQAPGELGVGQAIRIMTGAPMPHGADAVCIQEEVGETQGGRVEIPCAIRVGLNVRYPGEDIEAGTQVFAAGTELRAAHLGVLAAIGERTVVVHRQPVVGVLSTGDELIGDGGPLGEGKIRDANRPALLAFVTEVGARAVDLGIAGDDEHELLAIIERATASCDAVIVSGGASDGDRDPLASVLKKLAGSERVRSFHAAIRPAKPFVFAEVGEHFRPVFGLPGNPVSAIVAFELIARPAIERLAGHEVVTRSTIRGIASSDFPRRQDGKVHYVRALASADEAGVIRVQPARGQGAHMLLALASSNALVVLRDGSGALAGEAVEVLLLTHHRI
jgi:molybdenum cofactor synthesis domain-containing protein